MKGQIINGFELKRLLGRGGMAEVWYAENEIGKPAAVKILNENLSNSQQIVERFHNEALVMVKLNHPNIRQVYGYGYIGNRHCIIMEYLEGDDLEVLLKNGHRFTDEELRRWWDQTVDALNYTHTMGIVHRDIKPSNLFLDKYGNIKLLDFGIAKVKESISMTRTGMTMGTLMYMSPEQVKDPKRVDVRSDVYSLAVTFVHLLTGKPIYDSDTSSEFDIQLSIVSEPVDLSSVPLSWKGFIAPYLEKKPEDRPALRHFEVVASASPIAPQEKPIAENVAKPTIPNDNVTKAEDHKTPPPNVPSTRDPHSGLDSLSPEPKDKPKSKMGLWIGLGIAAAAVAVLVVLLLKPKKDENVAVDPDTEVFQTCRNVDDYRTYIAEYGRNAQHYNEAKQFIDNYIADSTARAQQKAEAEASARAVEDEEAAYQLCNTIANCRAYLKTYPDGRHAAIVQETLAGLEEDEAFAACITIAACDNYLKKYSNGRHVAEVRKKRDELKKTEAKPTGGSVAENAKPQQSQSEDQTKPLKETQPDKKQNNVAALQDKVNKELKVGNGVAVINEMKTLCELDPNNASIPFALGTVYGDESTRVYNPSTAISYYKQALRINPNYYDANYNLGALYVSLSNKKLVQANNITGMTQADNDRYDALVEEADQLLRTGLPYLEKAYGLEKDPQVLNVLKVVYKRLNITGKY